MISQAKSNPRCRGVAYVLALLLLAIFSTLAVAFAGATDLDLRKSENSRQDVEARLAAESGLTFYTYTLSQIQPSIGAEGTALVGEIADVLAAMLDGTPNLNGATICCTEGSDTITLPEISLGDGRGSFSATISLDGADSKRVCLAVVGQTGTVQRTLRMTFEAYQSDSVTFDYGVATKGSVILSGQAEILAFDGSSDISIFAGYDGGTQPAVSLSGKVTISGDIFTSDPNAEIRVDSGASVGGETGIDVNNSPHVHKGVGNVKFPEPDPSVFEPFATNIMSDSTPPVGTYTNIRIPAGTNPTFSSDTVLRGVFFVEYPNKVTFSGKVTIRGVVVTEDARESTDTNTLTFSGQVVSYGVETLPDEPQFAELRDLTGVFILAPGFDVSFGGQFTTVNGGIAADSITLSGQAGGTVKGPVICYDGDLNMGGLANLTIDRSGSKKLPPCFLGHPIMIPLPATYVEN